MSRVSAYDQYFFESFPNPERHINRLYVFANIFGCAPVALARARVLEIGCSTGFHLLSQAEHYPQSQFVGLDLSEQQITKGQEIIKTLHVSNVTLRAADIREFHEATQSFDYIICHGMFSWVPDQIRQAVLAKISELLSANGIAYLSFNSSSAWHHRESIQYLFRTIDAPQQLASDRIANARRLQKVLTQVLEGRFGQIQSRVHQELLRLTQTSDQLLLHEYLSENFRTFSVSQLNEMASAHGLSYFADARPRRNYHRYEMLLPQGALRKLFIGKKISEREDLYDSIEAKSFRGALLIKNSDARDAQFTYENLSTLYVSSPLVPLSQTADGQSQLFLMGNEDPVEITDRVFAQGLRAMHDVWPRALLLRDVFPEPWTADIRENIARLFWGQNIELSYDEYGCANKLPEKACISPLTRLQARTGGVLSSLRHEHYPANDFERLILSLLDGSRSGSDIVEEILESIARGDLQAATQDGQPISREMVLIAVDEALQNFIERGLICA